MTGSRPDQFVLTQPGPLRLYRTVELLRLPPPTWQIDQILPSGGLVGLYGPPGSFKSFLAIDMAMCIATNRPWHGHEVDPGLVLYVSAEGSAGIGKRVAAWLSFNQVNANDVNLAWLIEGITVNPDSEDMDVLFKRLDEGINDQRPSLVIIDTLARCFDGDENLQEDMGRFIGGVDRLRREFAATVLVVHHTRLDAERERGSTAFRGAADTMLSVARDPDDATVTLKCNKQKDAEEFSPKTLALAAVPQFDSCVLRDWQENAHGRILAALPANGATYTELRDLAKIGTTSLKRGLKLLLEGGELLKENGIYRRN